MGLIPVAGAQERSDLRHVVGRITPVEQVTPENSVVRTQIVFENVPQDRECTLRWYINDTLCAEDFHFRLTEGAVSRFACSVHFNGEIPSESVLWVEITPNDAPGDSRVFAEKLPVKAVRPDPDAGRDRYEIHVLRNHDMVIVYEKDAAGEYTLVANVFVCSTGRNNWTITGRYTAAEREEWLGLVGGVCGQYATLIWGNYLFHSVPYYGTDKGNLEDGEYNLLGQPASAGCIRLAVSDAKWIFDHIPYGTIVRLYDSEELPVEKPVPIRINEESPHPGWDPTDPDPDNPTRAASVPELPRPRVLKFHRVH